MTRPPLGLAPAALGQTEACAAVALADPQRAGQALFGLRAVDGLDALERAQRDAGAGHDQTVSHAGEVLELA